MRLNLICRTFATLLWISVLSIAASCSLVKEADPDQFSIDTGDVGELVPGMRHWMAWPQAHDYCVSRGKDAELIDLKGSMVIYRCVGGN